MSRYETTVANAIEKQAKALLDIADTMEIAEDATSIIGFEDELRDCHDSLMATVHNLRAKAVQV